MKNILEELNQEVGIKGSMVITPDGIMVAAALGLELEEELVAAIVSSLLVAARKAVSGLDAEGGLRSCLLHASLGKIMFYDMGNAFLVVVADTDLKIDSSIIAIRSAIHKIANRRMK
jgi:predicted regulator of Ras-like GTPase activity (Roadblock/LC7/MglB family)